MEIVPNLQPKKFYLDSTAKMSTNYVVNMFRNG